MEIRKQSCTLCAWRLDCQKKFSVSGRDIHCPDYSRDLSVKEDEAPDKKDE
ncbi:MAG: hypothetical protein HZB33_11125 [Nitrospirae bacterium]|nr:hypothetical protein [Nitrospirota bacterium]